MTVQVRGQDVFNTTVKTHTPAPGGTVTLNLIEATTHNITMPAGNITIAVSNEQVGNIFSIRILQDGTGGRTVTWFSTIKWSDGSAPTLTTTGAKADLVAFVVSGTDAYDGFLSGSNI